MTDGLTVLDVASKILETLEELVGFDDLLRLVLARTSKERAQALLDLQYHAEDVAVDKLEDAKFPPETEPER